MREQHRLRIAYLDRPITNSELSAETGLGLGAVDTILGSKGRL